MDAPGSLAALEGRLYLPALLRVSELEAGPPTVAGPTPAIPSETITQYANANQLGRVAVNLDADEVWAASHGGGAVRWDTRTGTYVRFTAPGDLPDNRVHTIHIDDSGSAWLGTGDGVAIAAAGGLGWRRLVQPDGSLLRGSVLAIEEDPVEGIWLGVRESGVIHRAADGSQQIFAGPRLTVGQQGAAGERFPVELAAARPLAELGAVEAPVVAYGEGCAPFRPAGDVRDAIALIHARRSDCSEFEMLRAAEQAGALAAVLFSSRSLSFPVGRVGEIGIPGLWIDAEAGSELWAEAASSQPPPARVWHDGAPELVRDVSSLAIEPGGDLWVGTVGSGILHHEQTRNRWAHYSADAPVQVEAAGEGLTIASRELLNTPRLAMTEGISGQLTDFGGACPGDVAEGSVQGRVAMFRLDARCSMSEKLHRLMEGGAVAAIGYVPGAELAEAGLWGPEAAELTLPSVMISADDAGRLQSMLAATDPVLVHLPSRPTSDCINAVVIDRFGNRWFAGADCNRARPLPGVIVGGLSRLGADGKTWRAYTFWEPVELAGWRYYGGWAMDIVNHLAFDRNDDQWRATDTLLYRMSAFGDYADISTAQGVFGIDDEDTGSTRHILFDTRGEMWVAGDRGVYRRSVAQEWSRMQAQASVAGNWVTSSAIGPEGDRWFATGVSIADPRVSASGAGYFEAEEGGWRNYAFSNTLDASERELGWFGGQVQTSFGYGLFEEIWSMLIDARGGKWFATLEGLSHLQPDNETWDTERFFPAWASVEVTAGGATSRYLAFEPAFGPSVGRLGAALAEYGQGCQAASETLLSGRVVLIDRTDPSARACTFWDQLMAAQAAGAEAVVGFSAEPSAELGRFFDPDLRIPMLFVHEAEGKRLLEALHRHRTVIVTLRSTLWSPGRAVYDLAEDRDGNLWVTSDNAANRLSPEGVWTSFHSRNSRLLDPGQTEATIGAVAVDARNQKWFGSLEHGVSRLSADDTIWTRFSRASTDGGLPSDAVWEIEVDADDAKWFGTLGGGLARLSEDSWEAYSESSTGGAIAGDNVYAIHFDGRDGWFGSAGAVALRTAEDGRWHRFEIDPTGHAPVTTISVDGQGDVWAGAAGLGLTRLSRSEPGDDCASALSLSPGAVVGSRLSSQADIDLYAVRVDEPFSRIELTVDDPEQQLDLFLRHSCIGIGGTGRHIGGTGRHIGGTGRHIGGTGRHIGGTGRHIGGADRLVFDALAETGTYFIDVRPRIGSRPGPISYRLRSGLTQVDLDSRRTLVLTDVDSVRNAWGLATDSEEYLSWLDGLRRLQADPVVGGLLITDLKTETSPEVRQAFGDWLANVDPDAVNDKANALAAALRDWIWQRRDEDLPRLQYVVIAADDRIIPHQRLRLDVTEQAGGWRPESDYLAGHGIDPQSTVGRALAEDRILSDDIYAAREAIDGRGAEGLHLPALSVGRLVERPAQMTAALESFFESQGVLHLGSSLVAASGAHTDLGEQLQQVLAEAGVEDAARSSLLGDRWQEDALAARLLGESHDAFVAAVPGDHGTLRAPDGFALRAKTLEAPADIGSMLALSLASHGGLNVPGAQHEDRLDWPEVWLGRGATYLASTGYQYGIDGELQYGEKLLAHTLRIAAQGDGRVIGDALAAAKQDYYADLSVTTPFHVATLAGSLLYGLPMARVEARSVEDEPAAGPETVWGAEASIQAEAEPARQAGPLQEVAPGLWSRTVQQAMEVGESVERPDGSRYTRLPGQQPWLEAGSAVQTLLRVELPEAETAAGSLPIRGLLWLGGETEEGQADHPWLPGAIASAPDGDDPAPAAAAGMQPPTPLALRLGLLRDAEAGELLVSGRSARALYVGAQAEARSGRQRWWTRIDSEELFSGDEDARAPVLRDAAIVPAGASARLVVDVVDDSAIHRVLVLLDAGGGRWRSQDLESASGDRWTVELPASTSEPLFVQAVDRAGNVGSVFAR